MSFARDRKIIARATGDEFLICLQLRGTMAIEQNGRKALLEAGDFTIIDPLLPYAGAFPNSSSMLLLKVPRLTLTEYLARIMQKEEKFYDGCGNKRAIHVANRCRDKLHRVSAERHSRHDRRYAASLRPSICPAQETHNRF
jgi:GGDEF domain-containing protein